MPFVAAQIPGSVQRVFRNFFSYLQNKFVVFFLTFLLFFMLLYAIYAALAQRLRVFGGEQGLSRQGKILSVALAMLTTLSIFYFTRGKSMDQILKDVLEPFGVLGGLVIALVIFLLIYNGFREDMGRGFAATLALLLAGLTLVVVGAALTHPNIMSWGWIIAAIAILIVGIGALIGHFRRPAGEGVHPGEGEGGRGPGEGDDGDRGPGGGDGGGGEGDPERRPRPGAVRNIRWCSDGPETVRISWDPNPEADHVQRYVIQEIRTFRRPRWHLDPSDHPEWVQRLDNGSNHRFRIAADNGRVGPWTEVHVRVGEQQCNAPPQPPEEPRVVIRPAIDPPTGAVNAQVNII